MENVMLDDSIAQLWNATLLLFSEKDNDMKI